MTQDNSKNQYQATDREVPNGAEQNGNGKGALALFTKQRNWKKWTAVNDEALLAIAADEDAQEYRLLALAMNRAWGNPNDPQDAAVDLAGKRMKQTDFARELAVSDQTISRWAEVLAAKNLLHVLDSGIYPVAVPSKPFPLANKRETHFQTPGKNPANYKKIKEEYFQAFPDKKRQVDEARTVLNTVKNELLAFYRARVRSEEPGNNGDSGFQTPADSSPDSSENGSRLQRDAYIRNARAVFIPEDIDPLGSAADPISEAEAPSPETLPVESNAPVLEALREYRPTDPQAAEILVRACRKRCPDAKPEEIVHFIHAKGAQITPEIESPIGLLLRYVPTYFAPDFREHLPATLQTHRVQNAPPGDRYEARRQAEREKFLRWTMEDREYAKRQQQAEGESDAGT
jgi:hypothetical protein